MYLGCVIDMSIGEDMYPFVTTRSWTTKNMVVALT